MQGPVRRQQRYGALCMVAGHHGACRTSCTCSCKPAHAPARLGMHRLTHRLSLPFPAAAGGPAEGSTPAHTAVALAALCPASLARQNVVFQSPVQVMGADVDAPSKVKYHS